jgi:uncharacterized protein
VGKIILAVVFTIVVVLWFKYMGSRRKPIEKPPKTPEAEDMVRCKVCGVNMPRSEAIKALGDYYCCDEHRNSGR